MKVLVLGASGRSGLRLVRLGIDAGHEVTAFARSRDKIDDMYAEDLPNELNVIIGDATDESALSQVMQGQDAVVNAAGNAMKPDGYVTLMAGIIRTAERVLGPDGRFWLFGSLSALDVPGTSIMSVDLPGMGELVQSHKTNFELVRSTTLNWSMICPGPMVGAADGQPRAALSLSTDVWPFDRPAITRLLPRVALALTLKRQSANLTVSFEDAAKVILDNLHANSRFSRTRVGMLRTTTKRRKSLL